MPFAINGWRQLALGRGIVQVAVIAVLWQQPRNVGHDERNGTMEFWREDLRFPIITRVRRRKEGPNSRRLIPPSLFLGQRLVTPVASSPTSREEIPEAQF